MISIHKMRRAYGRVASACVALAGAGFLVGCASERGVATEDAITDSMREAVQPPPQAAEPPAVREPAPSAPAEERFDVNVMDAEARDFFLGLVTGTSSNLVVHPDVTGRVTLTLKQVTVGEVLETVREVYGYDYRRAGNGYVVLPATLQNRVFEVDYLNLIRGGKSRTLVSSGQVTQGASDDGATSVDAIVSGVVESGSEGERITTGSVIETVNSADFWVELQATLAVVLGGGEGRQLVVNAQSGVVFARGMPDELRAVGEYLSHIHGAAKRQVVLEAKIIEVTLDDGFQAGVNWAAVQVQADGDVLAGGTLSGGSNLGGRLPQRSDPVTVGPGNPTLSFPTEAIGAGFALALDIGDFNAFVEILETQGETRVLSSPRVATLNNQKAVIKAGTDEFFVTDVSSNTVTGTAATTSRDVTLTPFFSGIALDVTPQISGNGEVILHIHPTVSEVTDQTKVLTVSGQTDELPLAFSEVRESDSIVRAMSGQIIAIGGLMRSASRRDDQSVPWFGRVPGLKRLFGSTRQTETKTELVILLRPIVVDDDSDWRGIIQPAADRISNLGT
jgi:MSHA biogenesis protein MshL